MSDEELEPLAPALKALLDAGGEGPPPPIRAKERVLERVEVTVHASSDEDAPRSWGPAAAAPATYVAPATDYTPRSIARRVQLLAAVFALGAMLGAAVVYVALRPDGKVPTAQTPPAPVAPSAAMPASDTEHLDPAPAASHDPLAPVSSARVEPHGSTSPPGRDAPLASESSLAAERALVETARAALARTDAAAALAVLARHAREFPNGTLAEEREALAVQALAKAGDVAKAKVRAQRFRERYPRSLFLPVVEEATRGD
ncbi:MAG TPA: hypothetical protein VNO21_19870 [Polyangiaceae bacterium]|nr:hypothetical protein [Polyangiaceae bacterium]